jgi:hypothetical protein
MIFGKCAASSPLARTGRTVLTALCLAGGAALGALPVVGIAHADHGQGGGGSDHSGPGRGGDRHDNGGRGHDDAPGHDANDDKGGLLGGGGADDPAAHDAKDDKGADGTIIPTTTAN